jgi:hypothetical protein
MEELLKKISCQSSKDDNEHSADQREVALSCQCFLLSKSQTDQYRRQNGKRPQPTCRKKVRLFRDLFLYFTH